MRYQTALHPDSFGPLTLLCQRLVYNSIHISNCQNRLRTITDNYNADICPSGITFTTKNFVDEPQLVTDATGNTYLNCANTTGVGGYQFFQITEGDDSLDWTDGTFTMVIDYYYTGGLNSIAFHVNGGGAVPNMIQDV